MAQRAHSRNADHARPVRAIAAVLPVLAMSVLTASCQREPAGGPLIATIDNSAAVAMLQRVNAGAQICWIKSRDKEFRPYKVIPELDTRTGKPRILIVSAKAAQGLPQLVIEAHGNPVKMESYGPLTARPISARINADVTRWATGGAGCKA